jgi:hypothetical protein
MVEVGGGENPPPQLFKQITPYLNDKKKTKKKKKI